MRESDLLIRRNLAESVPNIEEALSAQGGDEGEQGTASETPATDQTSIGQSDADAHMGPEADRQSGFQSPAQSDSSKMQQAQQPSELPEQPSDQQQEKTACALQDDWEPDSSGEEPSPVSRPGFGFLPTTLKGRIFLAVGLVVLAAIVVGSAYFMWDRWYRYDDHADLQGEWYVLGTTVPVTIDDSTIHLTDDVTYQYVINDRDKTIQYTFGRMEGKGRYWFSDDRQYLVITDGDEFTSSGTAFDDLIRTFSELPDRVSGNEVKLPEGEGIIVFSRTPDPDALARQQADAAAKVAAEEAARKEAERKAAEEAESEEYYYEEEPADDAPTGDAPAEEQSAEGESAEGDSAAEEPVEKERAEEG